MISHSLPRYCDVEKAYDEENEDISSHKGLCMNVYDSFICHSKIQRTM